MSAIRPSRISVLVSRTPRAERPQLSHGLAAARHDEALTTLHPIHDVAAMVPEITDRHITHAPMASPVRHNRARSVSPAPSGLPEPPPHSARGRAAPAMANRASADCWRRLPSPCLFLSTQDRLEQRNRTHCSPRRSQLTMHAPRLHRRRRRRRRSGHQHPQRARCVLPCTALGLPPGIPLRQLGRRS
jgi:hypothetical protein